MRTWKELLAARSRVVVDIWCETDDHDRPTRWGLVVYPADTGRDDSEAIYYAPRWRWRASAQRAGDYLRDRVRTFAASQR